MPISQKTRLLEWFADSSTKVQYPEQRASPDAEMKLPAFAWRHKMSLPVRIFLFFASLMMLFLGALLLFGIGMVVWSFV